MEVLCHLCLRGLVVSLAIGSLYCLCLSPPLHLFYKALPHAGSESVYVPGGGFAGFWYHLGLFESIPNLEDYDYYCYSSGCLSLLLAVLNTTVDSAYEECHAIQQAWRAGNISQYELVDHFLHRLVPDSPELGRFLPHLKVLVTSQTQGVEIQTARDRDELADLLIKTTWIPFVTGSGLMMDDKQERYLDGGFSRLLHPPCRYTVHVPITWKTTLHTLNPGIDRALVYEFWEMGRDATVQSPLNHSSSSSSSCFSQSHVLVSDDFTNVDSIPPFSFVDS